MLFTMRSKCLAWQSLSMVRNWPLPTKTCWMFLTRIATEMSSATVKTASLSSGYDCPHFAGWYIISTFNFHFRPLALPRKSRETARSRFARCTRWTGSESPSTCRANPTRCPVTLSKCWTSFSSHKSAKMSRKFFFPRSKNPMMKIQMLKYSLSFCKKGMMVPRGANVRMDQPVLTEGRQVWNGIHQSARISSWKTELGNVNHLTLNIDREF